MEKDKEISEDEQKRAANKIQLLTDSFINTSDEAGKKKEAELMEI